MVFRHLWGWSIPPRAEEWGSLLLLSPYTEGRVKAPGWVQLSHHTALSLLLCSQPCLFSPTSMNKIPVSELQTPEYCLGNGWQSIFIFSGTGTQTAQMDLKPNFRHNLYCFLFRTPGAFKTGEEQIPEDSSQTVVILPLQSHESTGELLHSQPPGKKFIGTGDKVSTKTCKW